jgi:hypothetical protein
MFQETLLHIVLQDAETVYPFNMPLYTSKLIFGVGVAYLL